MGTNLKSLGLVILVLLSTVQAESKHPIRFADLTKFKRVSDPQISPDGRWVAFAVGEQDIEGNWSRSHLWLVPFLGGEARQLTRGQNSNQRPRWSPDSRSLAFVSDRSGESQVWRIPVEGGEAWQVTRSITGASGVLWSLRGNRLLFTSRVFPECSDRDCNQKKFDQSKTQKIKARLVDRLLFRHWDHWREGRYTHLLATFADGGSARDLTPGAFDSPTWSLGGMDGYDISPDGKEICFTSNREEMSAASTNNDLYVVAVAGGELRKITDNPGSDTSPRYSSDGRWIAYLSQQRAGFESDRQRLMLYERDTRGIHEIKTGMDISISSFVWDFDSRTIYFTAQERVSFPLYKVMLDGGRPLKIVSGGVNGSVRVSADGHTLVFTRQSLTHPAEIHRRPVAGKKVRALTDFNRMLLEELELNSGESFEATSADGTPLHGFLLKPPACSTRGRNIPRCY